MAKKQYVNLSSSAQKPEYSPLVVLKASIDEKNPGDSKGQTGYFFIDPDGGNLPLKHFSDEMRPAGYQKDPKFGVTAPIDNAKMEAAAYIGSGGGDKFKFKYGKEKDASDAKAYPGDPSEVWRKVFVRVGHMKDCPTLDLGLIKPDYDPVFIEFEQDGGAKEITHYNVVFKMDAVISEVNQGQAPPEHSSQTVTVAVVDRIATAAVLEMSEQVWPARSALGKLKDWLAEKVAGKLMKWALPNGKLTWADNGWWIKEASVVMHEKDGTEDTRQLAAPNTIVLKDTRFTHYQHPEGPTCRKIMIDMPELQKQLKTMMTVNTQKVTLVVRIFTIDGAYLGLANGSTPKLMVATNDPMYGNKFPSGAIAKTLVHELGHIFGLVPRYLPVFSEDKAEEQSPEDNGKWYEAKGGLGSHCSEGAKEVKGTINNQPAMVMSGGSCIMFHAGDESKPLTFCGDCQKLLKRADLLKLGLRNVWPKGWSK